MEARASKLGLSPTRAKKGSLHHDFSTGQLTEDKHKEGNVCFEGSDTPNSNITASKRSADSVGSPTRPMEVATEKIQAHIEDGSCPQEMMTQIVSLTYKHPRNPTSPKQNRPNPTLDPKPTETQPSPQTQPSNSWKRRARVSTSLPFTTLQKFSPGARKKRSRPDHPKSPNAT